MYWILKILPALGSLGARGGPAAARDETPAGVLGRPSLAACPARARRLPRPAMPLTPKYTWREDKDNLELEIPLRGQRVSSVSVHILATRLTVSFTPYFLGIDLKEEIKWQTGDDYRAVSRNGRLRIFLKKAQSGVWGTLTFEGDDDAKRRRREDAEARKAALETELSAQMKSRRIADERKTLRQLMALEEGERREIEDLKMAEKKKAEEEMYATFRRLEEQQQRRAGAKAEDAAEGAAEITVEAAVEAPAEATAGPTKASALDREIEDEMDDEMIDAMLRECDDRGGDPPVLPAAAAAVDAGARPPPPPAEDPDSEDLVHVPAPRAAAGRVEISHTARVFPTPLRESKREEEDEWVQRHRPYLHRHPAMKHRLPKDARDISEADPTWLKGKGDDFLRGGDLESALNAYDAALRADAEHLPCLSNRALCHLRLGHAGPCIADCDRLAALCRRAAARDAALDASVAQSLGAAGRSAAPDGRAEAMLVRALSRKAAALSQLGNFSAAAEAMAAASEARPADAGLAADAARLSALSTAAALKGEGDALLGDGELLKAEAAYAAALAREPRFVAAHSNRAACAMAMGEHARCVEHCAAALRLLRAADAGEEGALACGPVPPEGSERRMQWVLRTLLRRGAALLQLGDVAGALRDHEEALQLDGGNEGLRQDVEALRLRAGATG